MSDAARLSQARTALLHGWQQGACPRVEDVLRSHPGLADDTGAVCDLVHVEAVLRQARGESLDVPGLCERFPRHAAALAARLLPEAATLPPAPPSEDATLMPPTDSAATLAPRPATAEDVPDGDTLRIPGYEILEELGRGGMGVVYKARHLKLRRVVALKMILAGGHADEAEVERFKTEAEAIARLQHPGIVQIHEISEVTVESGATCPYFSLEFCPGGSLAGLLHEYIDPREAAELVRTLAEAMQAAHAKGIIHRDLKPGNVLLTEDGSPKISDFGLARMTGESSVGGQQGKTRTGTILGTPDYMAPEQAAGNVKELGPPADVYSLGAMLYECLIGKPPLKGPTAFDTILLVLQKEPTPLREVRRKIPRDLETICMKCLRKQPGRRYRNAGELADDLRRFLAGEPIEGRPVGTIERAWRWQKAHWRLILAYVLGSTLGGCGFVLNSVMGFPGRDEVLPLALALPGALVVLRLVVGADGRVAAMVFAALAVPALIAWTVLPVRQDLPTGPLQMLVPAGVLACLVSLAWGISGWAVARWAVALVAYCAFGGQIVSQTLWRGVARPGDFFEATAVVFLIIGLNGLAMGLVVRLVSWALGRKPEWVVFGCIAGTVLGSWLVMIRLGLFGMEASRSATQGAAGDLLHAAVVGAFVASTVAGLFSPRHARADRAYSDDQTVPSTRTRRARPTVQRSTPGGHLGDS